MLFRSRSSLEFAPSVVHCCGPSHSTTKWMTSEMELMIPIVDTSPTIVGPIRGSDAKQIRDQVNANLSLSYSSMNGCPFIFVVVNQTQAPC